MTKIDVELPYPFKWIGMGYRENGDGYGLIRNEVSRQVHRIGASEARWDGKQSYKLCCLRAFLSRPEIAAQLGASK